MTHLEQSRCDQMKELPGFARIQSSPGAPFNFSAKPLQVSFGGFGMLSASCMLIPIHRLKLTTPQRSRYDLYQNGWRQPSGRSLPCLDQVRLSGCCGCAVRCWYTLNRWPRHRTLAYPSEQFTRRRIVVPRIWKPRVLQPMLELIWGSIWAIDTEWKTRAWNAGFHAFSPHARTNAGADVPRGIHTAQVNSRTACAGRPRGHGRRSSARFRAQAKIHS